MKHTENAITVGIMKPKKVHFLLPVSLYILIKVVAQGQCRRAKNIILKAVSQVQPLASRTFFNSNKLSNSVNCPVAR